jgi:hypothetical protein
VAIGGVNNGGLKDRCSSSFGHRRKDCSGGAGRAQKRQRQGADYAERAAVAGDLEDRSNTGTLVEIGSVMGTMRPRRAAAHDGGEATGWARSTAWTIGGSRSAAVLWN